MDSESNDYDITPVNNQCTNAIKTVVVPSHSGATSDTNKNIDDLQNQSIASSQYDSADIKSPKPMYGGYNNYKIIFRKENYFVHGKDEKNAIKIFLKNKIYKKDYLLEIIQNNKLSIYIVRANYKNKVKKIY
jgi:hypothetical protein